MPRPKTKSSSNPRSPDAVLVVDDDDELRAVVRQVLESDGYRVMDASNGAEALELLRSLDKEPGLILIDYRMPVMGGGEFLARVSEDDQLSLLPVVVMSASPLTRAPDGARELLRKPFRSSDVRRVARAYCRETVSSA